MEGNALSFPIIHGSHGTSRPVLGLANVWPCIVPERLALFAMDLSRKRLLRRQEADDAGMMEKVQGVGDILHGCGMRDRIQDVSN